MPWNITENLSEDIRTNLPSKAQEIFLNAFNSAWNGPCKDKASERDSCAFQRAWGTVKNLCWQEVDNWVSKALITACPVSYIRTGAGVNAGIGRAYGGGMLEWEVWDVAPPIPRGKGTGCQQAADQLPILYLIHRAGAGVDAGGGRAYGVRDF